MRPAAGRPWRTPLLVLLAMVAAFVLGAFLASRSELFPPQVRGEEPTLSGGSTPTPAAEAERWRGSIAGTTSQSYSAGPCRTRWRAPIELVVRPDGAVEGEGRARLRGRPRCPFPTSQPQITAYELVLAGLLRAGERFELSVRRVRATDGLFDYGGFAAAIADPGFVLEVPLERPGSARGRVRSTTTRDGHPVRADVVVVLACPSCGAD